MSLLTTSASAPSRIGRAPIGYAIEPNRGPVTSVNLSEGQGFARTSVDFQVDDANAPDHLLVKVTYGMYYKPDGWSYNSYTLKLFAAKNGDLHYERVAGIGKNLTSSDGRAQATPYIKFSKEFQLEFYCQARYLEGSNLDRPTRKQPGRFVVDMKSLSLKTG